MSLLANEADTLDEDGLTDFWLDEVHLVDQDENGGTRRELLESTKDALVGGKVALNIAGLNVEDVDENPNIGEDVDSLLREVVLHEGFLPAAVPEVEGQIAEELDMREINVNSGAAGDERSATIQLRELTVWRQLETTYSLLVSRAR